MKNFLYQVIDRFAQVNSKKTETLFILSFFRFILKGCSYHSLPLALYPRVIILSPMEFGLHFMKRRSVGY